MPSPGGAGAGGAEVDAATAEDLLRELAPQVLGALARRYGHFDLCEEAVQEALLAASVQWPGEGLPGNPRGWLITVASRRLTDALRAESARRQREEAAALEPPAAAAGPGPGGRPGPGPRRHADAAVPLLPPGAVAAVAGGADAPRGRRPDHRPDRTGVPGA